MIFLNLVFVLLWIIDSWFIVLQINTAITIVTKNRSSLMISLNSSRIQLGLVTGASIASLFIANGDISIIIFISVVTAVMIVITLLFNRIQID